MKATLQLNETPAAWDINDLPTLRESLRMLRTKGVLCSPDKKVNELITAAAKVSNFKARELLQSFFQDCAHTSRRIPPHQLDGIFEVGGSRESQTLDELSEIFDSVPEFVDRGPRMPQYERTLLKLSGPTERIEIVDPYLADMILKSPSKLWLLSKLLQDFNADFELVSGLPKTGSDWHTGNDKAKLNDEITTRFVPLLRASRAISLKILRPTKIADLHDREVTFHFESGFATFSLGFGLSRFGHDPLSSPDCHLMPRDMALSKRLSRRQMGMPHSEVFKAKT